MPGSSAEWRKYVPQETTYQKHFAAAAPQSCLGYRTLRARTDLDHMMSGRSTAEAP